MTRALVAATLWVLSGFVAGGGLFWAFLNTPESTIFTLALSLMLVLLLYVVAAVTTSGLVLGWSRGWTRASLVRSPSGLGLFVLPLALTALSWWLTGRALNWLDAHEGQISAWFIARLDWADVSWLLNGVRYAGQAFRWIVVPFVALVWLSHLLLHGARPIFTRATLARAAAPHRLALAGVVAAVTIWLPLRYALYWIPSGLPPSWMEPAVAAAKFGVMAVVAALGVGLIGALAARPAE